MTKAAVAPMSRLYMPRVIGVWKEEGGASLAVASLANNLAVICGLASTLDTAAAVATTAAAAAAAAAAKYWLESASL